MALLDILTYEGATMENSFSRGNGGVLVDVQAGKLNEFALPALGGVCDYPAEGDVRSGVAFDVYTGNLTLPAVGDVDQGVQYGTLGTEFTGTLEQPAEADVKLDVQYGAGGTEFTGTLAGGGGSNIFISID